MSREQLLTVYGRFYGEEHFAIAFTECVDKSQGDPKRVRTRGWDKTRPLADGDQGAAIVANRGVHRNPVIVCRSSNLVSLECDTENDLLGLEMLELPQTLTVRSSESYKRHFHFRPPADLEMLPYVAFRFESGKITADSGRYLLAPPALHPSGVQYAFLDGLGPDEVDIAELPEQAYRDLCTMAHRADREQRERVAHDPEAKVAVGNRHDHLRRISWAMRRYSGAGLKSIEAALLAENQTRLEEPKREELVLALAQYTFENVRPIGDDDE